MEMLEQVDVAVVGGGQAGLAAGYYLGREDCRFVILEQAVRVGDSWRNRWDSLVLFTSAQFNSLPGLPFPKAPELYPTKDEVADYLERYANTLELPLRLGTPIRSIKKGPGGYLIEAGSGAYLADQVVIATGPFHEPYIPPLSVDLPGQVFQVHSSQYRNPQQLTPGDVLVVGAANSGLQIAEELSRCRRVYLSAGKRRLQLPQRLLGRDLFWWLYKLKVMDISIESRLGHRLSQRDALVGSSPARLTRKHGVVLVGGAQRVQDGRVVFDTGQSIQVPNIVWATGYRSDYRWIDVPVFDERGVPLHQRGVTPAPGFYFLGLSWQHRRDSALLGGVGRDAAFIVSQIATHRHRPSSETVGRSSTD